jgi:hypothetical protein
MKDRVLKHVDAQGEVEDCEDKDHEKRGDHSRRKNTAMTSRTTIEVSSSAPSTSRSTPKGHDKERST